jgi:hypothetical protein
VSPNWLLGFESIWASSRLSAARTIDRLLAEILMEMPERMRAELAAWNVNCSTRHEIVVLPFQNLTGDPNQVYVADGLTASLTADPSRIRDAFIEGNLGVKLTA